nr:MAG TPA: hypothetical protein [Bacteriophage sp.]
MKNKEKYAKEIMEIACSGDSIAIAKEDGHIAPCCNIRCAECLFRDENCKGKVREWAEQEYIEKPVISKRDRAFLDYLIEYYTFIARDENGELFIYKTQPRRNEECCNWNSDGCFNLYVRFNVDFPMVKWKDDEPWLIEDLKKLEVVDSYE